MFCPEADETGETVAINRNDVNRRAEGVDYGGCLGPIARSDFLVVNESILFLILFLLVFTVTRADTHLDGGVPQNTMSSDKRFGVTVPTFEGAAVDWTKTNDLVELRSGRILGAINIDTAFTWMNHAELLPAWWSADDTSLLWQVDGKWGIDQQVLVRLKGGEIEWELDVAKVLEREILTRTEAADPKGFLEAKKRNWDDGSAFPEKFSFDSEAENANKGPLKFPVHFHVYLTSNPKGATDIPDADSSMEATLGYGGEIKVTGFRLGKSHSAPWYSLQIIH